MDAFKNTRPAVLPSSRLNDAGESSLKSALGSADSAAVSLRVGAKVHLPASHATGLLMNSIGRSTYTVDWRVLAAAGTAMLVLSVAFLWNDLQVQPELILVAASLVGAGVALSSKDRVALLGPAALLLCTVAGGLWFALGRSPLLLIGLAASWLASLIGVIHGGREPKSSGDRVHNVLLWHGFVLATVVSTSALYFQFLALGMPDQVGRKMVLTLVWLVAGLVLLVAAQRREQRVVRDAAFAFVALAVAKALFSDSVQLSGFLRVSEFAIAGALLWTGAWAVARKRIGAL
jgi:hypothetical protein